MKSPARLTPRFPRPGRQRPRLRPADPAERLLRRRARVLQGHQRRLRALLQEDHRQGREDRAGPRRLQRPGARRGRRPGRRRGDHEHHHRRRVPGREGRGRQGLGQALPATTRRRPPRPCCSWCATATPRASRTGTTWSSPASRSWWSTPRPAATAATPTWRPGATCEKKGGTDAQARGVRRPSCTRTCRCWRAAAATPPPPSCSATSATC